MIKGHKHTEESKLKMSNSLMGHKHSKETLLKLSVSHKGKKLSQKTKDKISILKRGIKHSEETKKRIGISAKKVVKRGKESNFWRGGIWHEPYPTDWTKTLKRAIRERDHYTCRVCGKEPSIHCHHIDYNKKNCNTTNLITLCSSCHSKTNFNREYWIKLLIQLQEGGK